METFIDIIELSDGATCEICLTDRRVDILSFRINLIPRKNEKYVKAFVLSEKHRLFTREVSRIARKLKERYRSSFPIVDGIWTFETTTTHNRAWRSGFASTGFLLPNIDDDCGLSAARDSLQKCEPQILDDDKRICSSSTKKIYSATGENSTRITLKRIVTP